MVYLARTLALIWAGFWTFSLSESLAWHTPLQRMTICVAVGAAFVVSALVAWGSEVVGGLLVLAAGVLSAGAYAIWGPRDLSGTIRVTTLLVFDVPPVAAGTLFLIDHQHITRPSGASH